MYEQHTSETGIKVSFYFTNLMFSLHIALFISCIWIIIILFICLCLFIV